VQRPVSQRPVSRKTKQSSKKSRKPKPEDEQIRRALDLPEAEPEEYQDQEQDEDEDEDQEEQEEQVVKKTVPIPPQPLKETKKFQWKSTKTDQQLKSAIKKTTIKKKKKFSPTSCDAIVIESFEEETQTSSKSKPKTTSPVGASSQAYDFEHLGEDDRPQEVVTHQHFVGGVGEFVAKGLDLLLSNSCWKHESE